jgi:hypothetical protein
MEYDLAGIFAGARDTKGCLVMLTLEIVPDALARLRAAKADHIPSEIPGTAKPLHGMVALETLLPFRDENFPLD